jgi:isopenicillin-N N-acyltransferase-like protein
MSSHPRRTPEIDRNPLSQYFPAFTFRGSHREIGRQFGEACQPLIERHLDLALARLERRQRLSVAEALSRTARFRGYVERYAPFLAEEIEGLAEGAGIGQSQAYLLQLRAELDHHRVRDFEAAAECTTFVALSEATANGVGIVGQNADLPEFYSELGVMVELRPDDSPAVLMLTPAGQVSYIGINDRGMGAFANYLICDGWRDGYPRYLFSRLALQHDNVHDGLAAVRGVHRASSRNLIMLDRQDDALNFENTPTRGVSLRPQDGFLAHTNHYVAEELLEEERSEGPALENSRARLERITALLEKERGRFGVESAKAIFRDRGGLPNAICRVAGDVAGSDVVTFASVIAEPSEGRMWVAKGPPSRYSYQLHTFSA